MESLFLLIPVALVFCAIAIKLLLWAIDSGQYDDLDKESWRILNDDEAATRSASPAGTDDPADRIAGDRPDRSGGKANGKPRSGDAA